MQILLADNQPKVRFGLRVLLERQPGLKVVGEAVDAEDLLTQMEATCPDLILLGWELPGLVAVDPSASSGQRPSASRRGEPFVPGPCTCRPESLGLRTKGPGQVPKPWVLEPQDQGDQGPVACTEVPPEHDEGPSRSEPSGQGLLSALHRVSPDLCVIALSGRLEARRAAPDVGADAFVSKCDPPDRLLAAIGNCWHE